MAQATKTPRGAARSARRAAGIKRPSAIIEQASRVATAMREALLNISVVIPADYNPAKHNSISKVTDAILNSGKQNAGNKPVGRGWTANLSPRTVKQLTEQGVFG